MAQQGWTAGPPPETSAWKPGPPPADFKTDNAVGPDGKNVVVDGALSRFGAGFAQNVLPSTTPSDYIEGPMYAAQHPMDSIGLILRALWDSHAAQAGKTWDAGKRIFTSDTPQEQTRAMTEMLGHGLATVLPAIGPAAANAGEQIGSGDIAGGMGAAAGILTPIKAAASIGGGPARIRGPLRRTTNTPDADAVQFGRENNIPLDAGTVTGSQFVKNVQKKAGGSWGGANTVEATQRAQGDALAAAGQRLAERANDGGPSVGAVEAGEGIQSALRKRIEEFHAKATSAYERLREAEQQKPVRPPRDKSLTALDVSERTPLAVDVTAAVEQLQPLYKRLLRESELGIPMQGAKGRTLAALDGLMNAPNWAPLSVVDAALGELKAMARGADMPELRTGGQATAARAVQALDAQVRATAAKAGPEVFKALEEGRAATRSKYATAEAMDLIVPSSGEPRGVFQRLAANKDAGLVKLRELQKHAPEEVPKLARAVLEEILDRPTSEGGFKFADKAMADWQKLGAASKKILFPKDGHAAALDRFFLLAKKIGENPNPSGTAQTLNATNVIAGLPMYVLAKMLYTPSGVRALTGSLEIAVSPKPAAQAAAMARLSNAVREAGATLPKSAAENTTDQEETPRSSRRGTRQ